jgi:SAM-dependent methyltransferase
MTDATHWDSVYAGRDPEALSWFEAMPGLSAELIAAHAPPGAAVDVGAGASRVVDHLLEAGFGPVTAVDLSNEGLDVSRKRLGARADEVEWAVGDVTDWWPKHGYALWHDRAVFHFLTDEEDVGAYLAVLDHAVAPGGVAIIATFAEDGPEKCSGLPVQRYSPEDLAAMIEAHLPGQFTPVESRRHVHVTPAGREQRFQFSVFGKRA